MEEEKASNGNAQYLALMDGVDEITRTLKELHKEQVKLPDIKKLIGTVRRSPETFSSDGYKYFGIVVKEQQTLHVSAFGMNYDIPLDIGFNPITLIDGVEYSSPAEFQCLFVWSSVEIGRPPVTDMSINDITLPAGKRLPIETPLTNPSLYEPALEDIELTAGQEIAVEVYTRGFKTIVIMAIGDAAYEVSAAPSPDGSTPMKKVSLFTGLAGDSDSFITAFPAPYTIAYMKNTSAVTAKFSLWVYGV